MDQIFYFIGVLTCIILSLWLILRFIFGKNWQKKIVTTLLLGQGLLNASKKLAAELPANVRKETLAEVGTYFFLRLSRLGIIGIMIAIIQGKRIKFITLASVLNTDYSKRP